MYYIANFSVLAANEQRELSLQITDSVDEISCGSDESKEPVFCQADLWNLHRHQKTIHITDRFPRTWEGI
jgi:hypothetical protein